MYLRMNATSMLQERLIPGGVYSTLPVYSLLLSILARSKKFKSASEKQLNTTMNVLPTEDVTSDHITNSLNQTESLNNVITCKYDSSKLMRLRVKDEPFYLQIRNESLYIGPTGEEDAACFRVHRFKVSAMESDGQIILLETFQNGTFLSGMSNSEIGFENEENLEIESLQHIDGKFFAFSKEEGNRYLTIRHVQSGLFMSAASSSSSDTSGNWTISLVSERGHSTAFEMYPCDNF